MKQIPFFFLFVFLEVSSCCDKEVLPPTDCASKCAITQSQGTGNFNAARYFFDPIEKKCKFGRWTGSETIQPFETLEECEACGCE